MPDCPTRAQAVVATLPDTALRDALARLPAHAPVAVALSGGVDSAALAIVAATVCRDQGRGLHLFHIHHGLFPQADDWTARVQVLAQQLTVPLRVCQVQVEQGLGLGVEAAAREARYTALAEMAARVGVVALLLAHHRQDQAETVLLRLLRGTGVRGLAAMQPDAQRAGMRLLRPWLDLDREHILTLVDRYAHQTGWQPVQDPSNIDPSYARGALRKELLPVLHKFWPAWAVTLSRHARQSGEAADILDEVARDDLAGLHPDPVDGSFSLKDWRLLSAGRQALVLRYWLHGQGTAMPSDRRLAELLRQFRQLHALGHDRELLWQHGSRVVRCVRGRVILSRR